MSDSTTESDTLQSIRDVWNSNRLFGVEAGAAARCILDLIDTIHHVSGLPEIIVKRHSNRRAISAAFRPITNSQTGLVVRSKILLSGHQDTDTAIRVVTALLHETGHAIDMLALGNRELLFSSETHLRWNDWRKAVLRSEHVRELRREASEPPNQPGVTPCVVDYLYEATAWRNLQLHELWARSYAQYIATRNYDMELLEILRSPLDIPDQEYPDHWVRRQWNDEDFSPIESSIDMLFGGLGWLK